MKILYWTPQFWPEIGGMQILAMKALPVLKEYGHDILVITSHVGSDQPDKDDYKGISICRFHFWEALLNNDVSLIQEITKQIIELKKSYQPDVIHMDFSGYTAFFQQITAKYYACPTVVSVHGDLTSLKIGSDTTFQKLFRSADWVTSVSSDVLEKTRHLIPEINNCSSTIYACTNIPSVEPTPLTFEEPCIMSIGRLVHEKGFDTLIESIPLIAKQFPKLKVKIIGDGPERSSLEKLTNKLDLRDRIEFTGSLPNEEISTRINSSTIMAVPSRTQEGFGIVAIEAAIMARPVVATKVGGLAEIIIEGETGLLVEEGKADVLAGAIIEMLSNPERTRDMGKAAKFRAERKFSVTKYVNAYDQLYKKLVAGKSPEPGE